MHCCIWDGGRVKLFGLGRCFWETASNFYWLVGISSAGQRCLSRWGRHTKNRAGFSLQWGSWWKDLWNGIRDPTDKIGIKVVLYLWCQNRGFVWQSKCTWHELNSEMQAVAYSILMDGVPLTTRRWCPVSGPLQISLISGGWLPIQLCPLPS